MMMFHCNYISISEYILDSSVYSRRHSAISFCLRNFLFFHYNVTGDAAGPLRFSLRRSQFRSHPIRNFCFFRTEFYDGGLKLSLNSNRVLNLPAHSSSNLSALLSLASNVIIDRV